MMILLSNVDTVMHEAKVVWYKLYCKIHDRLINDQEGENIVPIMDSIAHAEVPCTLSYRAADNRGTLRFRDRCACRFSGRPNGGGEERGAQESDQDLTVITLPFMSVLSPARAPMRIHRLENMD